MTTMTQDYKVADISLAAFGHKEVELAEAEINATARNTYLWEAARLRGGPEGRG